MSDELKKVQPGAPLRIPAAAYNAFIDAAVEMRNRRFDRSSTQNSQSDTQTILVRNDSGEDRDRFEVLGIDAPIIDPDDNSQAFTDRIALCGVVPHEDGHQGRFVILAEPLATGKIGRAWVAGVCVTKVDVRDAAHGFADIADGEMGHLQSSTSGAATILWKPDGIGIQWAVIRFGAGGGSDMALLRLAGTTGRGGGYTAVRVRPNPSYSTINMQSGNYAAAADLGIGVVGNPGTPDCYALNVAEVRTGTHDLYNPPTRGLYLGLRHPLPAHDGKPVYIIADFDIWECD